MPHKFTADRRTESRSKKYRITNRASYTESLRRRGDLTVWVSDQALGLWSVPRRTTQGGQRTYSDLAIEICLTLSAVYKQPLRQTQGFMRSISTLLGVEIAVPDFSTLSRLGKALTLPATRKTDLSDLVHLVVPSQRCKHRLPVTDSTGLKIFGEG